MKNTDNETDVVSQLTYVINSFTRLIQCVTEQNDLYDEIKSMVNHVYKVKNWSIFRLDEATNQLFFTILESDSEAILKQIPIKLGEGIAGQVAATGTPQILCTVKEEEHSFSKSVDELTGFSTQSIIAVPILYKNKVLGVFELINVPDPNLFKSDPKQMILMQTFANFIGIIFLLANTHQEIIFSAERDALTGTYNRLFLKKVLDGTDTKCHILRKEHSNDMLLVMIDLNNFKAVNDSLGHLTGDSVLKETAHLLRSHFRKEDIIIRYGGDEFMLIIQPNDHKDVDLEKSVREKLDTISMALPHDCTLAFGISYGNVKEFSQLLCQADQLMYSDKGRKKEISNHAMRN